ncbi:TetR/AcrR family transcriptional regulator [Alistipes communis]|uniref:TetR/AcrR family transcriptional regulator n=1 Tax=Alistipes communis TaxID=2585118 RepID=UPI003AF7AE81
MQSNENIEQRIIATARRLFTEKGYVDTNMSDIAAAAGVQRTTLHYYFRTKELLFRAIYGDIVQKAVPRLQGILTQDTPFLERLNGIIDAYIALFLENPDLPRFILGEIQRDVDHLIEVLKVLKINHYLRDIIKMLVTEIQRGKLRHTPPRILFLTFYSLMIFPFLSRNLVTKLLLKDREQFADFLQEWKHNLLLQMSYLLSNDGDRKSILALMGEALGTKY